MATHVAIANTDVTMAIAHICSNSTYTDYHHQPANYILHGKR